MTQNIIQTRQEPDKKGPEAPSISLPKGGGAIRGIGEKFSANPVTGTGSMSVPLPTSPGRSGFGPQLSLSYDSGTGNGPFGFGWSLSLSSITRKTDKGLPQYLDSIDSDVFILSGVEDLVPVYRQNPDGSWVYEASGQLVVHEDDIDGFRVRRYRPRIEGLFARIERWKSIDSPDDVHWRSISKNNILTLYGYDANSRIFDPLDASRIFSWLICESRDDKGNGIRYLYKSEDGTVQMQSGQTDPFKAPHQYNRGPSSDPRRTAQRYLKQVLYGNRKPLLDSEGQRPRHMSDLLHPPSNTSDDWLFEVRFDYGELDGSDPTGQPEKPWLYRSDAFSGYRAGFEVRTCRRCERVLMLHHIPDQPATEDKAAQSGYQGVVRSTEFTYDDGLDPGVAPRAIYSFLKQVVQTGWKQEDTTITRCSLPPVEFTYTEAIVREVVEVIDQTSLENLPIGLDGRAYRWTDLHGEGIPGILTEQGGTWYYKRNWSPIPTGLSDGSEVMEVKFAPLETVILKPNVTLSGGADFMDLAGNGQPDVVVMGGSMAGLYEHDETEDWHPFRPFTAFLNRNLRDPNLRFIDLDGDGHADVFITEQQAFVWHASLAKEGFGPSSRVVKAIDEEKGPRIVFADGTESIYLADLSGDGLTDIVRIRNGEVCYWPNLGYCHFGAKIEMDNAPLFDHSDRFDHQRIRMADIDGSGTCDIIYLHHDGVRLYFNQSGNGWNQAQTLKVFPRTDDLSSILPIDLQGNGTACLVWSSSLPGDARSPMRYVNLMGNSKPHLLIKTVNNLGAETRVDYTPSTRFYLQDKQVGKPWVTRLPFPVHVVDRVETYDHISHNRFVTRYAYHHGYFDREEREFRGFGMVEQWDTEEFAAPAESDTLPDNSNINDTFYAPPIHTKTWFLTGIYPDRDRLIQQFESEYYHEPGLSVESERPLLLDDTILPSDLTSEEEREACRALKGYMLRQEVYADDAGPDATPGQIDRAGTPYTVTGQNFSIRVLQPRGTHRHAVFYTQVRETISNHYDRNPADPRIQHILTLEVDTYGNVLKEAAVGYGRRQPDPSLTFEDQARQTQILVTYTENRVTNIVDMTEDRRTPLPCESRSYELTGLNLPTGNNRFTFDEVRDAGATAIALEYEEDPTTGRLEKRLIEHICSYFRANDLGGVLQPGELQSLGLPFESYKLAFTPGLIDKVYGNRVTDNILADEGRYVHIGNDANWWIPSGKFFYSPDTVHSTMQELTYARQHFFLPHRSRDPFHTSTTSTESFINYDVHDLLMVETRDALGNRVTVDVNDYRVLKPRKISDPNRNQAEVAFDVLGMVAGTAVMGKPTPAPIEGDSLNSFNADLTQAEIDQFLADPKGQMAAALLSNATTRIVYDLTAYWREPDPIRKTPSVAATLTRETHVSDLLAGQQSRIQVSLSYSDGFGREIQRKIQAEAGSLEPGGSEINPRWVGSGWTVFNNKGKPVRQYEPFFSATHAFEFDVRIGVSPILFYDPLQRVISTLNPNHTWQKVVFNPWRQETWDVNDTLLIKPDEDVDVGDYFHRLTQDEYLPTWHSPRIGGAMGVQEQVAAQKTEAHANTPAIAHLDSLGRMFLTIAHNRVYRDGGSIADEFYRASIVFDIEGNQRDVLDALDRIVMHYDYDMLGTQIHSISMDAGKRWMLIDVAGQPMRAWDARGHEFRTEYDQLHRQVRQFIRGTDPLESDARVLNKDVLFGKVEYGEWEPDNVALNLRMRACKSYDNTGVVTIEAYDFKGNLLRGNRQLARDYKSVPDWAGTVELEPQVFSSSTTYDALNRLVSAVSPDNSEIKPTYNEANLLEQVQARLRGADEWTTFVEDIDYNAKGQRELIQYGNRVKTTYDYDPLTFRLTNLSTTRNSIGDLQSLSYTYDPSGNITYIKDAAQQTIFFANTKITPDTDYTYDAINQLIRATGREHIGQVGQVDHNDPPIHPLPHPNDNEAMRLYTESYEYDEMGNILAMIHQAGNGSWSRFYQYATDSNRLLATSMPGNDPGGSFSGKYEYNRHGSMTRMTHLPVILWDFAERMQASATQVVNDGTPETTYYVYDGSGQRIRKVTELATGQLKDERIYLGGFEVYRKRDGSGSVMLERETLHIMDDKHRVAVVETRTIGDDGSTTQLTRYQFSNHLGSASLELNDSGEIISYEEYYPYGSASYQAVDTSIRAAAKRYRYTGKERDEETGLFYYGARYYVGWLGRWTATDPLGIVDGFNLYRFVSNNPIKLVDATGFSGVDPDHDSDEKWSPGVDAPPTQEVVSERKAQTPGLVADSALDQVSSNLHSLGRMWAIGTFRPDIAHRELRAFARQILADPSGVLSDIGVAIFDSTLMGFQLRAYQLEEAITTDSDAEFHAAADKLGDVAGNLGTEVLLEAAGGAAAAAMPALRIGRNAMSPSVVGETLGNDLPGLFSFDTASHLEKGIAEMASRDAAKVATEVPTLRPRVTEDQMFFAKQSGEPLFFWRTGNANVAQNSDIKFKGKSLEGATPAIHTLKGLPVRQISGYGNKYVVMFTEGELLNSGFLINRNYYSSGEFFITPPKIPTEIGAWAYLEDAFKAADRFRQH